MASKYYTGRPTDYKPEFDEKICEFGELGYSGEEMAMNLGVVNKTLYNWADEHPSFLQAFTYARNASKAFMAKTVREGISNPDFNPRTPEVYMKFIMKVSEAREINLRGLKKAKTFSDKARVVIDAVADGKITTREAKEICETIAIGAKVEEVDALKTKLEEVEELIKKGISND